MDLITKKLISLQDLKYKEFTAKLIPTFKKESIIGIRTPAMRNLAKEIKNEPYIDDFFKELPHKYYEETLLHGMLIPLKYKDIDILLKELDKFLKYAKSWSITDVISPKLFKKYPEKALKYIKKWLNSKDEYKVRFAVVSLLQFYLDDYFKEEYLYLVKDINLDTYYVNMAISWYYSFALIKQYDSTIKLFENKELTPWIHNKGIEKAIDSYRISDDRKAYLKSLKIKKVR